MTNQDKFEDDEIVRTFNSIKQLQRESTPVLRESVFRDVFMPFFMNEEGADPRVGLDTWLAFSGGPFNEVKVVDDSNGTPLFTVPPVMCNRKLEPMRGEGGRSLMKLLDLAKIRDGIIPGQGNALFIEGMKKFEFISPTADATDKAMKDRWVDIVARYRPDQAAKPSEASEVDISPSDVEFE